MSPTTRTLVIVGAMVITKIVIMNGIGYAARKQLKKTHPDLAAYMLRARKGS